MSDTGDSMTPAERDALVKQAMETISNFPITDERRNLDAVNMRRIAQNTIALTAHLSAGEPVAWMNPMNGAVIDARKKKQIGDGEGYPNFSTPLYAALTAPQSAGEPVAIVRKSMTGGNAGLSRHVEITADFILNDGELLYTHPPAQRDGAAVAELKNIVNAKRFDVDVFEDDTQFADWAQSRARHILSAEEPKCQCLELHPDYCHVHAA